MSIKKKDSVIISLPLRNASDFYSITLEHDYILTHDELDRSINKQTAKYARWFFPELKLLSFKEGTAEILNKSDKEFFKLYIKVEPEKLLVSCSCGRDVEKLCIHAFKALSHFIVYGNLSNLRKFIPNGAAQIVLENSKYFEPNKSLSSMFKPKAALGSVFGVSGKLANYNIEDVLTLPAQESTKKEIKENEMSYIIMISQRRNFLPGLLPCLGKLNKAGNNIKSFGKFLSGIQKEYDALLTDGQRELNNICLDLWKQVEKLPPELIHENMLYNETDGLSNVFGLWQKAIGLLDQQYTYVLPYYQKGQLKGKPRLAWMQKININKTIPVIEFKLTDKGAFYQLEMIPVIDGKAIAKYEMLDTFFIKDGKNVYLLSSIRDAAIAEWMEKSRKRITIFKEHFAQFKISFLMPIERHYLVKEKSN